MFLISDGGQLKVTDTGRDTVVCLIMGTIWGSDPLNIHVNIQDIHEYPDSRVHDSSTSFNISLEYLNKYSHEHSFQFENSFKCPILIS